MVATRKPSPYVSSSIVVFNTTNDIGEYVALSLVGAVQSGSPFGTVPSQCHSLFGQPYITLAISLSRFVTHPPSGPVGRRKEEGDPGRG
eukprot:6123864-Pyramimonas_sp.AAC.1